MLKLSSFSKKYATKVVLNIGDATLPDGIVWLKGENGAGKSTFMGCAAGMLPFKGDISLLDSAISLKKTPHTYRAHVNIAEAEPVFPHFMTGLEILNFFKEAKAGNDVQQAALLAQLGNPTFLGEKIHTYSSGMKKKLSLLIAFTGTPRLILLDEPLITLDKEAQAAILDLISSTASATCKILVSSHQEMHASALGTVNSILLQDGKLVFPQSF